jgi:uncharacterized membrane-anchored protein YhcB (DUF1043 family)
MEDEFVGYLLIWVFICLLVSLLGRNKKVGFWGAFLWSFFLSPIVGAIVASLSPTSIQTEYEIHKWKEFVEKGKKAEYKEQFKEAIDFYMDALYHLENDYSNLNKKLNNSRMNLVVTYKSKVEELKSKL